MKILFPLPSTVQPGIAACQALPEKNTPLRVPKLIDKNTALAYSVARLPSARRSGISAAGVHRHPV